MLTLQKILIIFLLFSLSSVVFANGFNSFDQFNKFDKQDKQEFDRLKKETKHCIINWDFDCARNNLGKMKKYITSRKDNTIISSLWDDLYAQKREKERQEEAQRQAEEAQRQANSNKSINITDCSYTNWNRQTMCTLNVNGSYDGNIVYYYKNNVYNIFITGSNSASIISGGYNPSLNNIDTTACGESSIGSVNSVSQALYMYANCAINGHY